jgi:hypothetical protein
MTKWRKKPVVIEAVQFDVGGAHKTRLPDGVIVTKHSPGADNFNYMGFEFGIETLEGVMQVRDRDWIITGVKGERYPCKPDIFEATYEAADKPSKHDGEAARWMARVIKLEAKIAEIRKVIA